MKPWENPKRDLLLAPWSSGLTDGTKLYGGHFISVTKVSHSASPQLFLGGQIPGRHLAEVGIAPGRAEHPQPSFRHLLRDRRTQVDLGRPPPHPPLKRGCRWEAAGGGRCRGKRGRVRGSHPASPLLRPAAAPPGGRWSLRDARRTGPTPGGRKGGVRMACGIQNAAKRLCRGFAGEKKKRVAARRGEAPQGQVRRAVAAAAVARHEPFSEQRLPT